VHEILKAWNVCRDRDHLLDVEDLVVCRDFVGPVERIYPVLYEDNIVQGIFEFNIVPLIFSKKNFSISKLMKKLVYPLWIFGRSDTLLLMKRFASLVRRLLMYLRDQTPFLEKRSLIEDVFKAAKNAFGFARMHKYTTKSVKKTVCLNVLLLGLVISLGFGEKIGLQRLSEW